MLLFKFPGALQTMRKKMFYWRVVYYYRIAFQNGFFQNKLLHKFSRFFIAVMVLKMFQKGARARKEEKLHDYAARKANIKAHENAFWDEELAAHEPDVSMAEAAVHFQRTLEWATRDDPKAWHAYSLAARFPFTTGEAEGSSKKGEARLQ